MVEVIIIDYELGNLFSVRNACERIGLNVAISNDISDVENAKALILPGVGAFKEAMDNLKKLNLIDPIKKHIKEGKPFLGICLGLQLLFSKSEEFGDFKGLDMIKGIVRRIPNTNGHEKVPVPQIGWNKIKSFKDDVYSHSPLQSVGEDDFVYFVHSYYVDPERDEEVLTKTNYGSLNYCSSVLKNNIFATQFHPEKSGKLGLEIYENWAKNYNLI